MKYQIAYTNEAAKQLKKLPSGDAKRIAKKIGSFAFDPRPYGYKKLDYYTDYFRFRVGDYRVIYQIDDNVKIVEIVEVKRRNESTY